MSYAVSYRICEASSPGAELELTVTFKIYLCNVAGGTLRPVDDRHRGDHRRQSGPGAGRPGRQEAGK